MKRALLISGAILVLTSGSLALAAPESLLPPGFDRPRPTPAPSPTLTPGPRATPAAPAALHPSAHRGPGARLALRTVHG